MSRFGTLGTQYFDDAGDPLIDGKIYFYESGTTTAKNTYADINQSIANANPVVLTGAGRQPNIFFNGTARAILTTASGVQVEVRDPVGGEADEGVFSPWNTLTLYDKNDIVRGSDDKFYISIANGSQGNDPTTSSNYWTEVKFIRVWNSAENYAIGAVAQGSNGLLYVSLSSGNLNNDPLSDTANWGGATTANVPPVIRSGAKLYSYNNLG